MNKKIMSIVIAGLIIVAVIAAIIINAPVKLDKPENVTVTYDGNGTLNVSWNAVEKATSYVVTEGNNEFEVTDSSLNIPDVEEGLTHNVSVTAVAEKRKKRYYSEVATSSIDVEIMLGKIGDVTYSVRGSYMYLNWENAEGASGYEIKLFDQTPVELSKPKARLTDCTDGEALKTNIRCVRTVGSYTYYGDWQQYNLSFPEYDYGNMLYEYAMDLDLERLKLFANAKGYSIEVEEKEGVVFADLSVKDPNNSGIANGISRIIGSAIGGYLVGAAGTANDTINEDFADITSVVGAFVEAGSVKEYAQEKKEEVQNNATASAIAYGLNALFMDTKIHYVFRYTDTNSSASVCEMYMLYPCNENYLTKRYANLEVGSDGYYHVKTPNGNPISIYTKVARIDTTSYNVTVIGYDK